MFLSKRSRSIVSERGREREKIVRVREREREIRKVRERERKKEREKTKYFLEGIRNYNSMYINLILG